MKKALAILLLSSLLAGVLLGCQKQEVAGQQESAAINSNVQNSQTNPNASTPETQSSYTDEQAAMNNTKLSDVNLIQFQDPKPGQEIAVMKTSMGTIRIMLFREQAPKAVENFVVHAKNGYYNGLTFHRVIKDFIIQSGDPKGDGTGGHSIYKDEEGNYKNFESEFSPDLWNFRGALTMARSQEPDSNGSQFFIVQATKVEEDTIEHMKKIQFPNKVIEKYKQVGGIPSYDWRYTVFGMVLEGMDVVDSIAGVQTNPDTNVPVQPVIVENIEMETA